MMPRFAVLNGPIVMNTIMADSKAIADEVTKLNCVEVADTDAVILGGIYDSETHTFSPRVSQPEDGKTYSWVPGLNAWVEKGEVD
jgi:hypothetical protein